MADVCFDITSFPTFPVSINSLIETIEIEEETGGPKSEKFLKISIPTTETSDVTISKLKVNGLPDNFFVTYFKPDGSVYNPENNNTAPLVISPGKDGPRLKIEGLLSSKYDNNKIFNVTVSFTVKCTTSSVETAVSLPWFAIKTKKKSSNATFIVVSVVVVLIILVLIGLSILLVYYFKNKRALDQSRNFAITYSNTLKPSLTPTLSENYFLNNRKALYYKFI